MSYEVSITIKGGRVEIEGDSTADLVKRIGKLDIRAIEGAITRARSGKPARARRTTKARRAR